MAIGDDISEVLEELGASVEVTPVTGPIVTGEFIIAKNYPEQSTEFIRQNCWSGTIAYDSVITEGFILSFSGIKTIVMNVKPDVFEDSTIIKNIFMVETNVEGRFGNIVKQRDPITKELTETLDFVISTIGLQIEDTRLPFTDITPMQREPASSDVLYIPNRDISVGQVWTPSLTEQTERYEVVNFSYRIYKNMMKVSLRKME